MKGYLLEFVNKEAWVNKCEILNVLIDEETLDGMKGDETILIKVGNKKRTVNAEVVFSNKNKAIKKAKEYNIKQEIKRDNLRECYWCKKKIVSDRDLTIDHIKPKSKCRTWEEAWDKSNMVISCFACNQNKEDLNPKLNLHIQRKAEFIKYKAPRLPLSNRKICSYISSKENNSQYISKRDSAFYNVKAFFMGKNYTKLA